jgi:hypothetical protein
MGGPSIAFMSSAVINVPLSGILGGEYIFSLKFSVFSKAELSTGDRDFLDTYALAFFSVHTTFEMHIITLFNCSTSIVSSPAWESISPFLSQGESHLIGVLGDLSGPLRETKASSLVNCRHRYCTVLQMPLRYGPDDCRHRHRNCR